MDLIKDVPADLSSLILLYIDRPLLLVDANTKEVVTSNKAAIEFFDLSAGLKGIYWPGIVAKLNVPSEVDLNHYAILSTPNHQKGTVYWAVLDYVDIETSAERRLVFQFERAAKTDALQDLWAVIVIDQSQLNQAVHDRNDFVALASHNLRTPLTGIKWNLELFLKKHSEELDPKSKRNLANALTSVNRMSELIGALLQVTRVETGKLKMAPKKVEVRDLLEDVVQSLSEEAKKRKVTVVKSFHNDLPPVMLDISLIRYLLYNLISNAIKYSSEGGEVLVFLSHTEDNMLLAQITDYGIGIPKAEQKNIFQKFYRVENAVRHSPDGTGLGLHLCRIIARKSGGDIWFESIEGKGTTFWFTVPMPENSTAHTGATKPNNTPPNDLSNPLV